MILDGSTLDLTGSICGTGPLLFLGRGYIVYEIKSGLHLQLRLYDRFIDKCRIYS